MDTAKLIKYFKTNKFDVQKARACILATDVCYSSYVNSKATKNVLSPIYTYIRPYDDNALFNQLIGQELLRKMAMEVYEGFLHDRRKFNKDLKRRIDISNDMDKFWQDYTVTKMQKKLTNIELLDYFNLFMKYWYEWWEFASFGEDKGQSVYDAFMPEFCRRHNLSEVRANEITAVLTHPKKIAIFNQERCDFLGLCILASNLKNPQPENKTIGGAIKKYIKKYFWLKTDFYVKKELKAEEILTEIKKEYKKKTIEKLKAEKIKLLESLTAIHKKKILFQKKYEFTEDEKNYFAFAEFMNAWLDHRKSEMMKQFYYLFSLVEDISVVNKISYKELAACFVSEIREFLKTGRFAYHKSADVFIIYSRNKKPAVIMGKKAKKFHQAAVSRQANSSVSLKGLVASRGHGGLIIRGKVKIITNPAKQTFKKGEILVTSMTRVEFISIMRKAKAIITDEGGIACHAAIVSRELGIPCIIGTKIATKVIKDGDLVEVDANRGIIKIIKRA